jgi:hypothetical protein
VPLRPYANAAALVVLAVGVGALGASRVRRRPPPRPAHEGVQAV